MGPVPGPAQSFTSRSGFFTVVLAVTSVAPRLEGAVARPISRHWLPKGCQDCRTEQKLWPPQELLAAPGSSRRSPACSGRVHLPSLWPHLLRLL